MDQSRGGSAYSATASSRALRLAQMSLLPALGLAVIVEIGAGVSSGREVIEEFALKSSVMLAIAFIASFFQFRSFALSLSVTLGPLPGAALVLCASVLSLRPPGLSVVLVYAVGFALAVVAGSNYSAHIAQGESPNTAARATFRDTARISAAVLVAATFLPCAIAIGRSPPSSSIALLFAAANAVGVVSAWLVVPLMASLATEGEDFISRTNRFRETWARGFERVTWATRSPWNGSMAGIFIVLSVSAAFGGARVGSAVLQHPGAEVEIASAAAVIVLASIIAARRWRNVLAISAVIATAALLAGWGYARSHAKIGETTALLTAELCAIVFVPFGAIAIEVARAACEDTASAFQSGIMSAGPAALIMLLAILGFFVPSYSPAEEGGLAIALVLLFGLGSALFLLPALATAIEAFIPRRQTLADRYRVK